MKALCFQIPCFLFRLTIPQAAFRSKSQNERWGHSCNRASQGCRCKPRFVVRRNWFAGDADAGQAGLLHLSNRTGKALPLRARSPLILSGLRPFSCLMAEQSRLLSYTQQEDLRGCDLIYVLGAERGFGVDSEWLRIGFDDSGRFERYEFTSMIHKNGGRPFKA